MRKLPIGIQSFEIIRKDEYIYVDKTEYIWNLVNRGKAYFLSRPRRFGKSLLLSTIEAYFKGQKELFKDLSIEKHENSEENPCKEYPILHFDFTGGDYNAENGLSNVLSNILNLVEDRYSIERDEALDLPIRFSNLIDKLREKTGEPVVVLVDEYDKPLLDTMADCPDMESKNRRTLKNFFAVLKKQDKNIRFVFITGVTKFSKVSIFSDLNQLEDISLDASASALCGLTKEELENVFAKEINEIASENDISFEGCVEELKKNYDGYHFSEDLIDVYNPFSILNALKKKSFDRFWFETGTPTFLIKLLVKSGMPVQNFSDGVIISKDQLMTPGEEVTYNLIQFFYQSGYLTISKFDKKFREFTLAFPNEEVKYGFYEALIPTVNATYTAKIGTGQFSSSRMIHYLENADVDDFMTMLQALLASIPYYEGKTQENEQQWRNILYAIFSILGQFVMTEIHSAMGRSDSVLENQKYIYIFEFKQDKTAEEALNQIDDKGYAKPYLASEKTVKKIGANFSTEQGTIDKWVIEGVE